MHFITGKGGVGKSSIAAAKALQLSKDTRGHILLLDLLGQGNAFRALGHKKVCYETHRCFDQENIWVARIDPHNAFKEYLSVLLGMGSSDNALLGLTARLRDGMTDFIADNKVVRAFVRACPGLEPIVMLGKVCWEAQKGEAPEIEIPWEHVVIDSPSSGHFIQLFKSTEALVKVFPKGPVLSQAQRILQMVRDTTQCEISLVTLPEELPLEEALELHKDLGKLQLPTPRFIINKHPFESDIQKDISAPQNWESQVQLEEEILQDQRKLIQNFADSLIQKYFKIYPQPGDVNFEWVEKLQQQLRLEAKG